MVTYTDGSGQTVFIGTGAMERLHAALDPSLSTADVEAERQRAIAEGVARVDKDPLWEELRGTVAGVLDETHKLAEATEHQREDLRPERFELWENQAKDSHVESLLERTGKVREHLGALKKAYAAPAVPMPLTSADASILQVRLNVLDSASPEEARSLVEDGFQREDIPFLVAAGVKLRSWTGKRNHWSGPEAEPIGRELAARIERAVWTPAKEVASYASERAEAAGQAWGLIARAAVKVGKGFEEIEAYRSTGALSPLMDPDQ